MATGSKDNLILIHDLRKKNEVSTLNYAEGEICSIKFSYNWLASGDNANNINIYDIR